MYIMREELPNSVRAHAIEGRQGERELALKNTASFGSDTPSKPEISALHSWPPESWNSVQKPTLEEVGVLPPYVEEFLHPEVKNADAWNLLQTAGLLSASYRHRVFESLWNTHLEEILNQKILQIHAVGAALAKVVIEISKQRQEMVERLSRFIVEDKTLVEKSTTLFDEILKSRESSGGVALPNAAVVGVLPDDENFSLLEAFGKRAWERVRASVDGEKFLNKLLTYETKNLNPAMVKEKLELAEYQKLETLVMGLQKTKMAVKKQIGMWKGILNRNPQAIDSNAALLKLEERVHKIIQNLSEDM